MFRDNYMYATAKIRVLESYLMSDADLTRVVEAKDPETAFKAFNSLDYAGELLDLEAKDYQVAMNRKLTRLHKVLEQIIPDKELLSLILLSHDYHNCKIVLKEKFTESDFSHMLDVEGMCKIDQLRRYIIEEKSADIPSEMKKQIDELLSILGNEPHPENIENLTDKMQAEQTAQQATALKNPFIEKAFALIHDRNMLKLFLRAQRLEKPRSWFEQHAIDAGTLSLHVLKESYEQADDQMIITLIDRQFGPIIKTYTEQYLQDKNISHIERGMNHVIIEHLKKAKLIGCGPEAVVAYYIAKLFAVQNLSTAMALKFGNVDPDKIRTQLTPHYRLS